MSARWLDVPSDSSYTFCKSIQTVHRFIANRRFAAIARFQAMLVFCTILLLTSTRVDAATEAEGLEFFEKRIRPLLVEHCYECHSGLKQKGGLRLDSAAAVLSGGDSGPAIVPGKPEESLLITSVSWSDSDLQMPPKNKLPDREMEALREWVRQGAPDPRQETNPPAPAQAPTTTSHWAYQPVQQYAPPETKDEDWPRNDIDRFILSRLEEKKINPNSDADRSTLLRRLYFDLIGLPPTPGQTDSFLKNDSLDAWENEVERLLAMPEFGERWGRHWLDVARFGESVTLRGFVFREAWRYRDYVIDAFNADLPYDEFVREQLSGDLMPASDLAQKRKRLIATTFLTIGNTNLEEQDKAQLRMDIVDEQLDTIGKAFLAQTIGCARCHDHKFDHIPTKDYYAMAGILRNTISVTNANVSGWIELPLPLEPEQEEAIRNHEKAVASIQAELQSLQPRNPAIRRTNDLPGIIADSAHAKAIGEWKHSQVLKRYIGDGYLHDDASGKGEKTLTFNPDLKKAGHYEVRFAYLHSPSRSSKAPVTIFHADGETTVYVNQQEEPPLEGHFVSIGKFRFEGNGFGHVVVSNEGTSGHVTADAVQFLPVEGAAATLANNIVKTTNNAVRLKELEAQLKKLQNNIPKRTMYMGVREDEQIADTYIHVRGSVHHKGPIVPRGFLQVASHGECPAIPPSQSGRREFAEWIASSSNPLTARVMANRVWRWLIGYGLVRTVDNFGTTGEVPSHRELLDHLASEFVTNGWSMKGLIRYIVLSRTYQLSSAGGEQGLAIDPENRLFWRAARQRLEAECIRDSMLAVAGQLSSAKRGGPTYRPGMSADYGFLFSEPVRSVYVPAFRNALPELFEMFDFADPSMVVGVRNVSSVAPQALFLLNHPFVRAQARGAAERLLAMDVKSDQEQIVHAYRATLGREPSRTEIELARRRLQNGNSEEGWVDLFHALFASAEFRYVE
ncbi:MAG: DUF1553 domain-containing protein [Verrucomicrobiales bacterium]